MSKNKKRYIRYVLIGFLFVAVLTSMYFISSIIVKKEFEKRDNEVLQKEEEYRKANEIYGECLSTVRTEHFSKMDTWCRDNSIETIENNLVEGYFLCTDFIQTEEGKSEEKEYESEMHLCNKLKPYKKW